MSDECANDASFSQDDTDACPPTERDPSRPAPLPPVGVALSVLWWHEDAETPAPSA